jgi:splicing factor 3B subunit 4
MSAAIEQRNQDATCYVGNLDEKVNEELLWELMIQVGPVVNVHMPRDKVTGKHQGYGFVEFRSEEDADYAMKVLNMVKLFQKPIKLNKTAQDKRQVDVGANLFVGNLDPDVDEKLLYDTFGAFGGILTTPRLMRDPDTGMSKGYGFVQFDSFEAADFAIECMNGQYLANRPLVVQYAFKKETPGERHGSQAERLLAASQPKVRPHTIFSGGVGDTAVQVGNPMGTLMGGATMDPQVAYQMQMAAYAQQLQYAQSMPGYLMPGATNPAMYGAPAVAMPPPPPPMVSQGYPGYSIPTQATFIPPPPPPPPAM